MKFRTKTRSSSLKKLRRSIFVTARELMDSYAILPVLLSCTFRHYRSSATILILLLQSQRLALT